MNNKLIPITVVCFLFFHLGYSQSPLPNAHAHNDYEHNRPLYDALDNGFTSVEADVHLIDGKLYVSHDPPKDLKNTPLLEDLYLKPLLKRSQENNGRIYPGYDGPFYLMVDFKTKAEDTYLALDVLLKKYSSMLSTINSEGVEDAKAVKVFISGNRPIQQVMNAETKYAGLDGRPLDLEQGFDASIMPVISDNYRNFLSWNGDGKIKPDEWTRLRLFVDFAHMMGHKVRLWAAPDNPVVWEFLLLHEIDLINTDKLAEFNQFMRQK